jgi:hypothetical protein
VIAHALGADDLLLQLVLFLQLVEERVAQLVAIQRVEGDALRLRIEAKVLGQLLLQTGQVPLVRMLRLGSEFVQDVADKTGNVVF